MEDPAAVHNGCDSSADRVAIRMRPDEPHFQGLIPTARIAVEPAGLARSPVKSAERSKQAEVTAVIKVRENDAVQHPVVNQARGAGDVGKMAFAVVVKQDLGLGPIESGVTRAEENLRISVVIDVGDL